MHARKSLGSFCNRREKRSGDYITIDAAEDLTHKLDSAVGNEVGAMNARPANACREEAGAIDVPDVVGGRQLSYQGRTIGQAAATEAAGAEVFQTGGSAEDGIASAIKSSGAIGEVGDGGTVIIIGRAGG